MLNPDYKYVGYKTALATPTKIVEIDSIIVDSKTEHYSSIYRFCDDILNLKTLKAIRKGTLFYADFLVFDIDDRDQLGRALDSTRRLEAYFDFRDIHYQTWFSGSKGFHVNVPTCQFCFEPTDNEAILKTMASEIAADAKIKVDPSIYNVSRIFRLPGSVNSKSGLYKVPINRYNTIEEVLELAKQPQEDIYPEPEDYGYNPKLGALYNALCDKVRVNRALNPSEDHRETVLFPILKKGERNDGLYKLARKLARRSIGEKDALRICKWWSDGLENPMTEREIQKTVASAYTKGVNELVDEDTFGSHFFDANQSLSKVIRVISNINQNVIKTGFDFLDDYTMGLYRGDLFFIIARPGNFKTCILSSLLASISCKTHGKTILFSMEMSVERLTIRHIQAAEGMTQNEVIKAAQNNHKFEKYEKMFKDVEIVGLSSLSIEMVIGLIDYYKEEHGQINAIGFDYLSLFRGAANNTETTARIATELKTRVAKSANCPVFCLVQGRRAYEGNGGDVEIDRQAGKDSSSIEDSADFMIGLWGKKYGRFLKSRTFNSDKYRENPYFLFNVDKPRMKAESMSLLEDSERPKFKQAHHQND